MLQTMNRLLLAACLALPMTSLPAAEIVIPGALVKLAEYVETTAREPGPLVQLLVSEGDEVKAGDLLARIDDTEQLLLSERAKIAGEIARREAENRVTMDSAERSLKLAAEELRRAREAVQKFPDTISQQELDRLDNVAEQAKLAVLKVKHETALAEQNVLLKQAEYQLAEANLANRKIVAPIAGTVVRIDVQRGEWVEPGRKIIRIVHIDQLRVEGVLDATAAEKIARHAAVEFRLGESDLVFRGRLLFVSPEVDPFTRKVRVIAIVENSERRLRPGVKGSLTVLDAP